MDKVKIYLTHATNCNKMILYLQKMMTWKKYYWIIDREL